MLVYVAKLRGGSGLRWITWAGGGFSLVEVAVLAVIILSGDWKRYATEARQRQETARAAAAADTAAVAPQVEPQVEPLLLIDGAEGGWEVASTPDAASAIERGNQE